MRSLCEQIVVEFLRAADVEDGVGFAIELLDLRQAQARGRLLRQIARAEAPAALEAEFARQLAENFGGIAKSLFASNVIGL